MKNSFPSTNSLRGIGILAVLVNHYINLNITGDNTGFANLWVSIFFITSGYGITFSLNRRLRSGSGTLRNILSFYYSRAIHTLPLFFIAIFIESLVRSNGRTAFMIPGLHYSGHYWFVISILQCYLIAPVIYYFMNKSRIATVYGSIILLIALNCIIHENVLPYMLVNALKILHFDYRNIFFMHILIFSLSMCIPSYMENWKNIAFFEKKAIFFIAIFFIILGMISVRYSNEINFVRVIMENSLYSIVLIFIMSMYVISNSIFFFKISFIGEISYPLYLFHMSIYLSVDNYFNLPMNSLLEALLCFAFISLLIVTKSFFMGSYSRTAQRSRLKV